MCHSLGERDGLGEEWLLGAERDWACETRGSSLRKTPSSRLCVDAGGLVPSRTPPPAPPWLSP